MWAYIPMFRLFALVVGLRDAFQPLGPTLLQPLVDFPRLLAAFPVDVIRIVGPFWVSCRQAVMRLFMASG